MWQNGSSVKPRSRESGSSLLDLRPTCLCASCSWATSCCSLWSSALSSFSLWQAPSAWCRAPSSSASRRCSFRSERASRLRELCSVGPRPSDRIKYSQTAFPPKSHVLACLQCGFLDHFHLCPLCRHFYSCFLSWITFSSLPYFLIPLTFPQRVPLPVYTCMFAFSILFTCVFCLFVLVQDHVELHSATTRPTSLTVFLLLLPQSKQNSPLGTSKMVCRWDWFTSLLRSWALSFWRDVSLCRRADSRLQIRSICCSARVVCHTSTS